MANVATRSILVGQRCASRSQKGKKDIQLKQLFALLGSASVKAAHKDIDEIDPRGQFHQHFMNSFCASWFTLLAYSIEQCFPIFLKWRTIKAFGNFRRTMKAPRGPKRLTIINYFSVVFFYLYKVQIWDNILKVRSLKSFLRTFCEILSDYNWTLGNTGIEHMG